MREILFRGKGVRNGRWYYGSLSGVQIESNSIISVSLNAFEFNGEYLLEHNDIVVERDEGWLW